MEYTKEIHDEIEGIFEEKKSPMGTALTLFRNAGYCFLTVAVAIWLGEFYHGKSENITTSAIFIIFLIMMPMVIPVCISDIERKGKRYPADRIRKFFGKFIEDSRQVEFLSEPQKAVDGMIDVKSLRFYDKFNEMRRKAVRNVPKNMLNTVFMARMEKYFKEEVPRNVILMEQKNIERVEKYSRDIRKSLIKSWKENRKISQEYEKAQRKHYGIFYKLFEKLRKPKEVKRIEKI
jgi:hypothetical protein